MSNQSKSAVNDLLTEQIGTRNATTKDWVAGMKGMTLTFDGDVMTEFNITTTDDDHKKRFTDLLGAAARKQKPTE
jgi:hypothetical protein